jgi:hypothetical protein
VHVHDAPGAERGPESTDLRRPAHGIDNDDNVLGCRFVLQHRADAFRDPAAAHPVQLVSESALICASALCAASAQVLACREQKHSEVPLQAFGELRLPARKGTGKRDDQTRH